MSNVTNIIFCILLSILFELKTVKLLICHPTKTKYLLLRKIDEYQCEIINESGLQKIYDVAQDQSNKDEEDSEETVEFLIDFNFHLETFEKVKETDNLKLNAQFFMKKNCKFWSEQCQFYRLIKIMLENVNMFVYLEK